MRVANSGTRRLWYRSSVGMCGCGLPSRRRSVLLSSPERVPIPKEPHGGSGGAAPWDWGLLSRVDRRLEVGC